MTPPARTRIVLLGRLAIDRDDVPAAGAGLPGRRSEIVFAYLAAEHRRGVSRDELADALWPEMLPDTWNAALRSVLSDVRRFLERAGLDPATTLITEQGRCQLRLPPDAVVDIDEARTALSAAREQLAAGDAEAAAANAQIAADLAALPFLSYHEGAWADAIREELDGVHIRALDLQAHAQAAAGDARAAAAAADRLVRADPFSESAHRLRIEMLGQAGDRAGALKAYERCKALLAAELGVSPSEETESALRLALEAATPAHPPDVPAPAPGRFASYSVLVVEDHDFQRRTALSLLRGLGITALFEAADGHAALELLADAGESPDVIVCDIDMPGMDGVEFIRNVAERRLACAVVIASGLDRRLLETVRAASVGYGLQVLGAVGKPLTARALEELLGAYRPLPPVGHDDGPAAEQALAAALDGGRLEVAYEPVVDLGAGAVSGVRVIVADAPARDVFAVADRAGLGRRLAEHMLTAAARDVGEHPGVTTWLPLASGLVTDVSLADALAAIARDDIVLVSGTASLARSDQPAALDVLARLRVKGYKLCLDGLGTPNLPAERLARLPLTHVLLSGQAVAAATADAAEAAALQESVDAARALDVPVLGPCATAAEFDVLLQLGCSYAHGPWVGEAVPAAGLGERVASWTAPPMATDLGR